MSHIEQQQLIVAKVRATAALHVRSSVRSSYLSRDYTWHVLKKRHSVLSVPRL